MDEREIRLRCIEAASRAPVVHNEGPAVGVLKIAQAWAEWVASPVTRTADEDPLWFTSKGVSSLY